jgi:catechol 2,3-dioxygenase-like lactoylglutathione lyase family enzyme
MNPMPENQSIEPLEPMNNDPSGKSRLIGRMTRVMLFVKDVPGVAAFYRDVLGLEVVGEMTKGWVELHSAAHPLSARGKASAKIVFGVADVSAAKKLIEGRGVKMGKIQSFSGIDICDGKDPEGNLFQISSRGM